MEINLNTRVYDILNEYGDIADVMEVFGIKRVGRYSIRRIITRFLSVKRAAFVHRTPADNFLKMLQDSIFLPDDYQRQHFNHCCIHRCATQGCSQ